MCLRFTVQLLMLRHTIQDLMISLMSFHKRMLITHELRISLKTSPQLCSNFKKISPLSLKNLGIKISYSSRVLLISVSQK